MSEAINGVIPIRTKMGCQAFFAWNAWKRCAKNQGARASSCICRVSFSGRAPRPRLKNCAPALMKSSCYALEEKEARAGSHPSVLACRFAAVECYLCCRVQTLTPILLSNRDCQLCESLQLSSEFSPCGRFSTSAPTLPPTVL